MENVAVVENGEKVSGIALEYLYVYHESYSSVCLDCSSVSKSSVQVLSVSNLFNILCFMFIWFVITSIY